MKRALIASSIALLLLASTSGFAQSRQWQDDQQDLSRDGHWDADAGHHDRDERRDAEGRDGRGDRDQRWSRDNRHAYGDRDDRDDDDDARDGHGRGYGYGQAYGDGHDNGLHRGQYRPDFRRGQRLSRLYMDPRYDVQDYVDYNLAPPPRGYRWVRPDDGRFLLIATATGLIAQILGAGY